MTNNQPEIIEQPQVDLAQQQQDIQAMQTGLADAEVPPLPEEKYAGLSAWATRSILKSVAPKAAPKPKKVLLRELGLEEKIEVPEAMLQTRPTAKPIDVKKEALDLKASDLDEYDMSDSWQMNFDTIETEDDVKGIIAQMAEKNKESITKARRGIVSDEQLRGLANDLGSTPDFIANVLNRKHGEMMTGEHILATRQVLEQSAMELKKLSQLVTNPETNTDANRLAFGKQYQFHKQFMNEFMGMRAEFGRGLRAFGVMKQDGIETSLINEQMQYIQSGMDINTIASQIASAPTTKGITQMVKAQDGWLKKSGNVFIENFINSILSGAKTHIINTTGSSMRLGMDVLDTAVAARLGKNLPNDEDKILVDEWKAGVFGLINGFNDALNTSWQVMKTAEPYGGATKLDTGSQKYISSEYLGLKQGQSWYSPGSVIDALGSVIRFPTERLMGAEDAFFKKMTERQTIAALSYREANRIARERGLNDKEAREMLASLMENPTEEMMAEASEKSLTVTFQRPLGEIGQMAQKLTYSNPVTTYLMPFVKTPTNLLKEAFLERTPLALMTKEYKEAVKSGGAKGQMAQAKMYVGSSITTFAAMMASNGTITGSDPSDPKEREAKRATGWRPYSFYDGENYYSYQRFEPYSYLFSSLADFSDVMARQDEELLGETEEQFAERFAASWAVAISNSTLDRTFMTGLRDFFQVADDPKRYMSGYMAKQANANIPYSGLRRDITRVFDDTSKLTGSWTEQIKANTPGLSKDIPNKLDALGEPIKFDAVLNPWAVVEKTDDKLWLEIGRLAESTRKSALSKMTPEIGKIRLQPKEYHDLVKFTRKELEIDGLNLRNAIMELVNSPEYAELIDEYKVNQIAKIKQAYDKAGKAQFLQDHPELLRKVIKKKIAGAAKQEAKMGGMTEAEAKQQILDEIFYGEQ